MLTNKQQDTLNEIAIFIEMNGYPPTNYEMAAVFNVSQNAIASRLKLMRKKGAIDWKDNQARTLHIIAKG